MKWFTSAALMCWLCLAFAFPAQGLPPKEVKDAQKEKREEQQKDWKSLHGEWRLVKATLGGKDVHPVPIDASHTARVLFGVDGMGVQIVAGNKVIETGAFELDPTTSPRRMTFNGMTGIYLIEGDRLEIAFNTLNAKVPPQNSAGHGRFEMIWHLERIKIAK